MLHLGEYGELPGYGLNSELAPSPKGVCASWLPRFAHSQIPRTLVVFLEERNEEVTTNSVVVCKASVCVIVGHRSLRWRGRAIAHQNTLKQRALIV